MLALPAWLSALAGAAVVVGLRLLVLPLLDPKLWQWRALLLGSAMLLAWRYMIWRFTDTVAPLGWTADALFSWGFAILEALTVLSSTFAFLILSRVKERSLEADRHRDWWKPGPAPQVDIFIATYNEQLEVLERTIVGAKAIGYPALRIFILDDGRRDWLRAACERHGVGYLIRPDNAHAKAGNINHALRLRAGDPDAPDFIAVLDADFVPHIDFVERVLALFHAHDVGLVQTPQHFFNPDPIQHNLGISSAYPDEQRHFFDNVEPSRDAWGIAVCCGTSSMVRVRAVEAIGGFPTESVTEDFLLTLRLSENGWRTVYLNEPLTEGLAPEGLQEYIVQRGRWCLGMMQIVRNVYSPFGDNRLGFRQRLSIFDSLLYWSTTFPFRLASLICPLLYWWGGVTVVNASVTDILVYYLPYYLAVMIVLNWLSKGLFIAILNDVAQLVAAWPITRAVALGLLTPGPHKFSVTAKGGDRTKVVVQWPLMMPFLLLFALTVGGLIVPLTSDFIFNHTTAAGDGMAIVMFWTIYNLFVLLVAIAACIEKPRPNRPQRQIVEPVTLLMAGQEQRGWLVNLGVGGARVSGVSDLQPGMTGVLRLPIIGDIEARIIAPTQDGYRIGFAPTAEQRDRIIARLHTASAAPGTNQGNIALMIRELARALTR
ncbi:Cellulose synthase (UDP-forming) OS=Bosea thiooxidans OX=53254 GN=SAMN05660750_02135 PE=4 SV=1 [Bosea thiooxidans]|uniref:Cellulose synthase (UDP-forming) n=1 Tax=Bosea thiooxidans TaxID=53254 RepID=A0A1T5DW80_9HYPH|nr:cellulose synthase catalytic subunit [Bosea thiooxidans]SKB75816.1 cellulose synthase (UDP-forming) [Bosea thiooxidans]